MAKIDWCDRCDEDKAITGIEVAVGNVYEMLDGHNDVIKRFDLCGVCSGKVLKYLVTKLSNRPEYEVGKAIQKMIEG